MLETDTENIEKVFDELNLNGNGRSNTKSWEDATEMITIGTEDEIFQRLQEHFGGENTDTPKRLEHVKIEEYICTSPEARLANDEERYHRSGGEVQIYRENTFMANQARRVILEMLKSPKGSDDRTVPGT